MNFIAFRLSLHKFQRGFLKESYILKTGFLVPSLLVTPIIYNFFVALISYGALQLSKGYEVIDASALCRKAWTGNLKLKMLILRIKRFYPQLQT
jgi:hypothetical protein